MGVMREIHCMCGHVICVEMTDREEKLEAENERLRAFVQEVYDHGYNGDRAILEELLGALEEK